MTAAFALQSTNRRLSIPPKSDALAPEDSIEVLNEALLEFLAGLWVATPVASADLDDVPSERPP